jgi:hypothetical protein
VNYEPEYYAPAPPQEYLPPPREPESAPPADVPERRIISFRAPEKTPVAEPVAEPAPTTVPPVSGDTSGQKPDRTAGAAAVGALAVAARRDKEYILYNIFIEVQDAYTSGTMLYISLTDDYDLRKLERSAAWMDGALKERGLTVAVKKYAPPADPDKELIEKLRELSGGILEVS